MTVLPSRKAINRGYVSSFRGAQSTILTLDLKGVEHASDDPEHPVWYVGAILHDSRLDLGLAIDQVECDTDEDQPSSLFIDHLRSRMVACAGPDCNF